MCAGWRGDASSRGGTFQHPTDASSAFCVLRRRILCMRRSPLSRYIFWSAGFFFQLEDWRYMPSGVSGYVWNWRKGWQYEQLSFKNSRDARTCQITEWAFRIRCRIDAVFIRNKSQAIQTMAVELCMHIQTITTFVLSFNQNLFLFLYLQLREVVSIACRTTEAH